jgi:hypothetical protein
VAAIFHLFKALVENLLSSKIKTIQLDGGTKFKPIIRSHPEIQFHIYCPYTPQQNEIVERKHRHIVELSLATMFNAGITQAYWPDIFESVTFVINTLPSSFISFITPYHTLFNKTFDYNFFKVLGCRCFPFTRPYAANKLAPRSSSCAFLGYSSTYKGYKPLHLETNKFFLSRHAIFDETSFRFKEYTSPTIPTSVSSSLSPLVVIQPSNHYPQSSHSTISLIPYHHLPLPLYLHNHSYCLILILHYL